MPKLKEVIVKNCNIGLYQLLAHHIQHAYKIDNNVSKMIQDKEVINLQNQQGQTLLMLAIQYQRLDYVKALTLAKIELEVRDNNGFTALLYAAHAKNKDILAWLLEAGANPNVVADNGETLLAFAVREQDFHLFRSLTPLSKNIVNVKLKNKDAYDQCTPLGVAIMKVQTKNNQEYAFYKKVIEQLLFYKADPHDCFPDKTAFEYLDTIVLSKAMKKIRNTLIIHALQGSGFNRYAKQIYQAICQQSMLFGKKDLLNQHVIDFLCKIFSVGNPVVNKMQWLDELQTQIYCNLEERREKKNRLFEAIVSSDIKTVEKFLILEKEFDVNEMGELSYETGQSKTLLVMAVKCRHLPIIELLINAGATINNQASNNQMTALMASAQGHCLENEMAADELAVMQYLLGLEPQINVQDATGKTALHYAVIRDKKLEQQVGCATFAKVQLLLNDGADPNITDHQGNTPLMYAVKYPHLLEALIAKGAQVNLTNKVGETALKLAKYQQKSVQLLIKAGASDAILYAKGMTQLMYAIVWHDYQLFSELIEDKTLLNAQNHKGQTALIIAVLHNEIVYVDGLVRAGAKLDICDNQGKTAIFYAKNTDIQHYLIHAGANICHITPERETLLGQGAKWSQAKLVRQLLRKGLPKKILETKNTRGETPFALALYNRRTFEKKEPMKIIKHLLISGVDPYTSQDFSDLLSNRKGSANYTGWGHSFVEKGKEIGLTRFLTRYALQGEGLFKVAQEFDKFIKRNTKKRKTVETDAQAMLAIFVHQQFALELNELKHIEKLKQVLTKTYGYSFKVINITQIKLNKLVDGFCLWVGIDKCDNATPFIKQYLQENNTVLSEKEYQEFTSLLAQEAPELKVGKDEKLAETDQLVLNKALKNAAKKNRILDIHELLAKGAQLNAVFSDEEKTPLMYAARSGRINAMQLLLDKGADFHQRDKQGSTLLMQAVNGLCKGDWFRSEQYRKREHGMAIQFILTKDKQCINLRDEMGQTALHHACALYVPNVMNQWRRAKLVSILLAYGADINTADDKGITPLMQATEQPAVVKILLARGANATAIDKQGRSVIQHWHKERESCYLLLNASVTIKDAQFPNELICAIKGDWAIDAPIQQLIADPALREATDATGRTALMLAAKYRKLNYVKQLLENGANLEARDHQGFTALFYAIRELANLEVINYLLHKKADMNVIANNGETVLSYALKRQWKSMIGVLVRKGVSPAVINTRLETKDAYYQHTPLEIVMADMLAPSSKAYNCRGILDALLATGISINVAIDFFKSRIFMAEILQNLATEFDGFMQKNFPDIQKEKAQVNAQLEHFLRQRFELPQDLNSSYWDDPKVSILAKQITQDYGWTFAAKLSLNYSRFNHFPVAQAPDKISHLLEIHAIYSQPGAVLPM